MSTRRNNLLKLPATRTRANAASPLAAFSKLIADAEALQQQGQTAQAATLYRDYLNRCPQALGHAAAFNLGVLLAQAGCIAEAIDAYRDAIARQPDFLEPRINLGSLYELQGRDADALAVWQAAADSEANGQAPRIALQVQALNNIGRLLEGSRRYPEAEDALRRSLALQPQQPDVIQHWVHLRQKQCKWPVYQPLPGLPVAAQLQASSPLAMLAHTDDPSLQLLASQGFVQRKLALPQATLAAGRRSRHGRLRIGYLSGDLCVHAVGLLLAEVIGAHDRRQFEIHAFDFSRDDGSRYQARLRAAFEHRHPIASLTDAQAAQLIADTGIDVLVDLHGLSSGTRPGILALRPAPVQVGWLGFIGSSAMPWVDYVIGDRFALTEEMQPYFTEQLLHMATPFLPRDSQREQGAPTTRAEQGLPEDRFVFASFNNAYKLNPEMFAAWMSILRQVPASVLWLLDDNPTATAQLRQQAAAAGVDPERLLFAQRTGYADFISRLQVADLFLDNHPYNAGSTAQDALCAGLPMLTLSGRSFVSRMAGSLLVHAGLPELVTFSHAEYITAAVALANDREQMDALRMRVCAAARRQGDAAAQARALESVLRQAAGLEPKAAGLRREAVEQQVRALLAADKAPASPGLQRLAEDTRCMLFASSMQPPCDWSGRPAATQGRRASQIDAVCEFLAQAEAEDGRLVGFLDEDFSLAAGLDARQLLARVQALPETTDAVGIALPADDSPFFLNLFEPVEAFDPGFTLLAQQFLAEADIAVDLATLVMDGRQAVASRWLLARPAFWRRWLTVAERLQAVLAERGELGLALAATSPADGQSSRAELLLDRIASVLLALDPCCQVEKLSASPAAELAAARQPLPGAAVLCDALKLALRATGRPEYLAAFAAQRERLQQWPVSVPDMVGA